MIHVHFIKALKDNYIYLIHKDQESWVIDPGEAEPVKKALKKQNLLLKGIINTHHHFDHTNGNHELKREFSCPIYAPLKGKNKIEEVDHWLKEGDEMELLGTKMQVLEVPGHTLDHIALYFKAIEAFFVGDTLFSLGCGRLFEGNPEQMWQSLQRIRSFPDSTRIYCGHEYTLANAHFAKHIESQNKELKELYSELSLQRQRGEPTLPSILSKEKRLNPFLRCDEVSFKQLLGLDSISSEQVFAYLREKRDRYTASCP